MVALFQSGGMFMYVILFVSIIALALFCERAGYLYFKMKINADAVFQKIRLLLEKMNYAAAIEECSRIEKHPLGRIMKAGLLHSDKRDRDIERILEENILKEIPKVKARVNLLTMFANVSTLLGLLGTIFGLIAAFQGVTAASEAVKQEILAKGISVAMLTTAFGLIVAIPCLVGYYVLNNRSDYIVDQMEEKALSLFNLLSSLKQESK